MRYALPQANKGAILAHGVGMSSDKTNTAQSTLRERMADDLANGDIFAQAVDYGRRYLAEAKSRNVAPAATDVAQLDALRQPLPEDSGDSQAVLQLLNDIGTPATMAQTGGRFFGLVNGSVIPASLAARLLADTWDQNAVLHAVSPVNAVLEEVCQGWLRELLGLPSQTVAGFVSGTSMAIVCSLAAARFRLLQRCGWDINRQGLHGAPRLRIVTSQHTHSTVVKAVALLGFGTDRLEMVDVDDQGRMQPDALPPLDDKTIVILQAGNVNSGSFDPIRAVCAKASAAGAWVHVDGAFGLWAAACESLAHLTDGIELAQSWSVDAHKTLNTPYDSGVVLCADEEALIMALQNSGAYIMYSEQRDSMLYTPEMSRRARAVDLWAALRYLGRQGVDELVSGLHQCAVEFADSLRAHDFQVLNDVCFNQIIVSVGDDATTRAMVAHIQDSGEAWVGASLWFEQPVIRISVCSWVTDTNDIRRAVEAFVNARQSVIG
jgi:glutamate/tyrosine decarboxylase-like PLP-dependent enzyme